MVCSEKSLMEKLKQGIDRTDKHIVLVAGHAPLLYDYGQRAVALGTYRWGEFSTHTFDLGARLAAYALDWGKDAHIGVLIDDDVERLFIRDEKGFRQVDPSWMKGRRKSFYKTASLPDAYHAILQKYGLDASVLLEQERSSGLKTPLIGEKKLKHFALVSGISAPNTCALGYKGFLFNEEFMDVHESYVIGFIPGQCTGNVCTGVLDAHDDIDATHVFYPHIEDLGGLYQGPDGAFVRMREPMRIADAYSQGLVSIRESRAKE